MSKQEARTTGKSVTASAQGALLAAVGAAIQKGGTEYAVEFCNLEATGLVDSLNKAHNCTITRVTNRKRNPDNRIETDYDKIAWNHFIEHPERKSEIDTVLLKGGATPVYYKPIYIGMETCLRCHGSRSTNIELATLDKIDSLYPSDAAVNYVMGDLRGMWKITFDK